MIGKKLFFTIIFALFFSFCGERGPLIIKPLPIPPEPKDVKIEQRGDIIRVEIAYPEKYKNGEPLVSLTKIKISGYKLNKGEEKKSFKEEIFFEKENVKLVKSKYTAEFKKPVKEGEILIRVYSFNKKLQSKSDENKFFILKTKSPPKIIEKTMEKGKVIIKWETTDDFEGFNIYKDKKDTPYKKVEGDIFSFEDKIKKDVKEVKYYISGILRKENLVETALSSPAVIKTVDKIPPAAVKNIKFLVSPEGFIILQWDKVEDIDIDGYEIFVSTDRENFKSLNNKKLIKENKFIFKTTEGKRKVYYFYIIAIDKSGNKSEKSEIIKVRI